MAAGSLPAFAQEPEEPANEPAAEPPAGPAEGWLGGWEIHGLSVHAGRFGIFRGQEDPEMGWEVHFAPRHFRFLPDDVEEVLPVVGGLVTGQGAFYGYLGFRVDVPLDGRWIITPFCAVGLYHYGDGRDLGGLVEFRTGFEVAYQLDEHGRIGFTLHHLSNGRFYERNPGSESLLLTYTTTLRRSRLPRQ
jgi:hypothetical protein